MQLPTSVRAILRIAPLFLLAVCAAAASGQGMLVPRPDVREWPFSIKRVQVTSTIRDALVETAVEQVFGNESEREQEGTYLFPLPEGATVTSFTLKAGDRTIEGRVLPKNEARGIYESIVRQRRDPALLEYTGGGVFRASVFPIPPHADRTLTLRYTQVLKMEGGMHKFEYPLSTGRFSTKPAASSSVSVKLRTTSPIKTVYSPTHDVSVRRDDERSASASWEAHGEFPDRDFALYYSTSGDDVGLSLITYDGGAGDPCFMLIASPRVSVPKEKTLPREIVFVLDRTGSMAEGKKLVQAKKALDYCLDRLNPNDRFGLITFNESTDRLAKELLPATQQNVDKAHRFIADLEPAGSTNIGEALKAAIEALRGESGVEKMVIFLTDGLPTVGETDVNVILDTVKRLNGDRELASARAGIPYGAAGVHARVFTFGVGHDVNVPFLDRLAADTRADADYVRPEESIEGIVSSFYAKVSSPILGRLALAFDGVDTYDVFPKSLPDLFKGSQLIVTGRYRGSIGSIRLTGNAMGHPATYRMEKAFGEDAARSPLVSRIWAARKIGYLLDEVRLHSNREVIDEIVRLSKEYGIITPYTSFLADERRDVALKERYLGGDSYSYDLVPLHKSIDAVHGAFGNLLGSSALSGSGAIDQSLGRRGYQDATRAPAQGQGGMGGYGGGLGGFGGAAAKTAPAGQGRGGWALDYGGVTGGQQGQAAPGTPGYRQMQQASTVQSIGSRVFFRRGQVWFDNAYRSEQKVVKVEALSDAHFQLLKALPELSRYANVGDEVVYSFGRTAFQIGQSGQKKLSDAEVRELTAK